MTPHRLFAILLAALLAASHVLSAQNAPRNAPPAGTVLILGRVIDAMTGAPIAGATVSLMRSENDSAVELAASTGSDGQFMFAGLPAGPAMLTARKSGYAPGALDQSRPEPHIVPSSLLLSANERRGDVVLRLWKYSAISGRVVDDAGEPVVGIRVTAYRRGFVAGRPAVESHAASATTDDRGMYRLYRLTPGDYFVGVLRESQSTPASNVEAAPPAQSGANPETRTTAELQIPDADRPGSFRALRVGDSYVLPGHPPPVVTADGVRIYPSVFYPGATSADEARPVTVGAAEVPGIDLTMRAVQAMSVTGAIVEAGKPVVHFPVRLVPSDASGNITAEFGNGFSTVTDARGRYTFAAVPPGSYSVTAFQGKNASWEASVIAFGGDDGGAVVTAFEAEPPPSNVPTKFATGSVIVRDQPVTVPPLSLATGVKVTGRLTFAGAAQRPADAELPMIRIVFERADGQSSGPDFEALATVNERGEFESLELPPGRYLVHAEPAREWVFASATAGARDVSVTPLDVGTTPVSGVDIRFTDRPATLAGTVSAARSPEPPTPVLVVVFPVDRSGWVDFGRTPRRLLERSPGEAGAFEFSSIPAGDYFIAAIASDGLREWRTPERLDVIARQATRIRATQGAQTSVSLAVIK